MPTTIIVLLKRHPEITNEEFINGCNAGVPHFQSMGIFKQGIVKRFNKFHVDPEQAKQLSTLKPGFAVSSFDAMVEVEVNSLEEFITDSEHAEYLEKVAGMQQKLIDLSSLQIMIGDYDVKFP
ncbi:hypothetical protein BDQ12DRAFT_691175 [Crucibulum laeve]|uniref:EthD domain-containing protein n=1 Tax=Crucibulum laeve TaxID=68775 RepID=A0A5C3LKX7_9AGAR|nr:hypothetical protein BDQ12DRAFT_691175 [Crucibulum laeve]